MGSLPSNTIANPKGKLKAITTRSGLVLDEPSVPMPPPFINPEEDERVEETFTTWNMLHINISLSDALILIPKYQKMLKSLLSNKEKLIELANTPVSENYLAAILKKLPEKLGDPGKFLILCGFNELKCKALADLEAIACTLILGRPFLQTARALIDVHGEEMILRDGNERLILTLEKLTTMPIQRPHQESFNMIDVYNVYMRKFMNILGGNPTPDFRIETKSSSSSPTTYSLEEKLEYLLNHDPIRIWIIFSKIRLMKILLMTNLDDTITLDVPQDEHALILSPPLWDDYDDNLFDHETINDDTYDDPFDSKEEKIKERVHVPNVLPTHPTLHLDSDFTISSDSLGSDLVVSFPSGTRNKIFDPGIFIRVQSKIFLSRDAFSISFIRDPLFPVIDTLLPFSSENEDKVVNTGILAAGEEQSPHLSSHRGLKALNESPMMIHGENTPNLGVRHLHFYPP
ncbi:hypothetical protein Tco_0860231 [Tanacetum coccineum]|uniref:Reverse transcriptase domain-containing protein n=1 Tax=Tanacetum coccineum TaxID=301880 RepID=A0ABQ5BG32_9ASTR